MIDSILPFIIKYKYIFLFYLIVIILLVIKRKKLDIQAKFIVLYRMKWGLKWMDKYSAKFREWVILLGYIGVGAGYVGLIFISYFLIKNIYLFFVTPEAVAGASLVYPGMTVPGLGVLPFWDWIIAIFVIALIHEFSHGVVARAHNIEVKNTGLVLFGPIFGAFVEPDEKKLRKDKDIVQYSVLAAGSFSNILLGIFAVLLLNLAFMPLEDGMTNSVGFTFNSYVEGPYPFEEAGVEPGMIITGIGDLETNKYEDFIEEFTHYRAGEEVIIRTTEEDFTLTLAQSPDNPQRGFMGIKEVKNELQVKEEYSAGVMFGVYKSTQWFNGFLRWLFLLSLGIGLFNLLPLPIVDGGRMAQVFLHKLKGPEVGERRYRQVAFFFLMVLLLNLFFPLIAKLF